MNKNVYAVPELVFSSHSSARHDAVLNAMQTQNFEYYRNLLARKKYERRMQLLQLQERRLHDLQMLESRIQLPFIAQNHIYYNNQLMYEATANNNYAYQQNYNYSTMLNDYTQMHTPLVVGPSIPIVIPTLSPIFTPHLDHLVNPNILPILSPVFPETLHENVSNVSFCSSSYTNYTGQYETISVPSNEQIFYNKDEEIRTETNTSTVDTNAKFHSQKFEDIEYYLQLPKDKFPSPKMSTFDHNIIIDEFCKLKNIQHHLPWLLDLEFGLPKTPVSRPIPIYNVIYNNIFCKFAPDVIHPDFDSCDNEFKSVLLFYYDCVVSAWYRGYVMIYGDDSVENFQSWLLLPMQVYGMSWS